MLKFPGYNSVSNDSYVDAAPPSLFLMYCTPCIADAYECFVGRSLDNRDSASINGHPLIERGALHIAQKPIFPVCVYYRRVILDEVRTILVQPILLF